MPADIIPFKPSVTGEGTPWPAERQIAETDEPFGEQFWQKIYVVDRAERARIDGEWERIRSFILASYEKLNGQLPTVNPWPIEAELEEFVRSAIDYYMYHARRFGIDKNGRPKAKHLIQKEG